MGKTVESYRIALEQEINRWNGFARTLRKEAQKLIEAGFEYVCNFEEIKLFRKRKWHEQKGAAGICGGAAGI